MPTDPKLRAVDDVLDAGDDDLDFDLEALRRAPTHIIDVETPLLSIPVRKPKTDEFFRTHLDDGYRQDLPLLQAEINDRKELYWVVPSYRGAVLERLATYRVYACLNRAKTVFLWPIPLKDVSVSRRWRDTALVIAEEARKSWVTKITSEGAYKVGIAKGDLGEPEWPEMTFTEMVKLAFTADDRTIRDDSHHAIKYITGEI